MLSLGHRQNEISRIVEPHQKHKYANRKNTQIQESLRYWVGRDFILTSRSTFGLS